MQAVADAQMRLFNHSYIQPLGVHDMKLPVAVVDKPQNPQSGSSHNYFSVASYFWPCNKKCNASLEPFDCGRLQLGEHSPVLVWSIY